jgi:hypothetical protein
MGEKIKLKLERIGNGLFTAALTKLCSLNIHTGRDTYALMRTVERVNPEIEAYRRTKEALLKKHGAQSNLASLRQLSEERGAQSAETKRLAELAPYEQLMLAPDAPGHAAFLEEMKPVNETEVELFLDHKVPLALDKIDGVFTAFELKELAETVAEFAEPRPGTEPRPGI